MVHLSLIRREELERNVEMFSDTNEKLRRELDDSEQTRARLDLAISQLRTSNRDLAGKLKVEKDEVGQAQLHNSKNFPVFL